jgi:outer membrane protein assembly factor BamB
MPGLPRDLLYAGLGGNVVALDCATGSERWRTRLKRSTSVTLATDGEHILATAAGEVFCLDATTGRQLWRNPLRGLGMGSATLLGPTGQSSGPPPAHGGR